MIARCLASVAGVLRTLALLAAFACADSTKAASRMPCGPLSCDPHTTYCETINTDVPALPSNYACRPLPVQCLPRSDGAPRDCRCFPRGSRGDYCAGRLQGGVQAFYRTTVGGH